MHEHPSSHLPVSPEIQEQMNAALGSAAETQADPVAEIVANVDPTALTEDDIENLIDLHPVTRELMQRLKEARNASVTAKEAEMDLMNAAREMRGMVGSEIKTRLGLEVETDEQKATRLEKERVEALEKIKASITGNESEEQLLSKYGFLNAEGKMSEDSIESPLFRTETKAAFRKYLKFAKNFDAMENAEKMSGVGLKKAPEASNMRREAHNAVSHMLSEDIGLEFEAARRFVAKMRDTVIPNSGETANYAQLLRGQKLVEQYNHDAAAMTEAQLGQLAHPEQAE